MKRHLLICGERGVGKSTLILYGTIQPVNRSYIRLFRLLRFLLVIQVMLDFRNHIFIVAFV